VYIIRVSVQGVLPADSRANSAEFECGGSPRTIAHLKPMSATVTVHDSRRRYLSGFGGDGEISEILALTDERQLRER
jgi:hypothetical protein